MIRSVPIGSKVICTDGSGGRTTAVIVDPVSRNLTHIAVVEQSFLHGEERLVPFDRVIKTTREAVYLNCTNEDILHMQPFTRTHYLETEYGEGGYAYSLPYVTTYNSVTMSPDLSYLTVQDQLVPAGEIAIHRGMVVEALDGPAGEVGELLLDPHSGQVTHFLLMKGHRSGKKEVAIEISQIARVVEDTIYLKIEKDKIDQLAALPVQRAWDEVYATELELMAWVFEETDLADQALKKVKELRKQYAMDLLNATVIKKDLDGKTHVHEERTGRSKRRGALGLALGGLAGLVVGPVAMVAGAIAGTAAGKKSARKLEVGFSKDRLRKLNERLVPGGSALFLLVEHGWFNTLQLELAESGGQLIHERLSDITFDELVERLSTGEKDA